MPTIEHVHREQLSEPDLSLEYLSLDEVGPMLKALSSDTATSLVSELSHDPATTAELADQVDTSIQNAGHHLSQLEEAGLVTVVGTRYSEKGREMDVYSLAVAGLVIEGNTAAHEEND